ncbi:MAG: Lrp/AsnC family transcriptional regulator [Candidatus Hydrothermarchaeota archaeon]|nr:MAG: Lrp/AsnC family transcriptional regulator [Candidatus Hydrothermarchaeota archaeon]
MKSKIDSIDRKILKILQEDCRMSYKDIGKKINLPKSTVHSRVRRLLKNGIIERCVAIVNPEKLGYSKIVWVGLTVEPEKIKEVAEKLAKYEEVQVVATTHGHHDLVIQVLAKDAKSLGDFVNEKIKTIEGVRTGVGMMHVSMFLDVYKYSHKVPL